MHPLVTPPPKIHKDTHLAVLNGATWDLLHLCVVFNVHLALTAANITSNRLNCIQRQVLHNSKVGSEQQQQQQ
jgi:hypothetical protein